MNRIVLLMALALIAAGCASAGSVKAPLKTSLNPANPKTCAEGQAADSVKSVGKISSDGSNLSGRAIIYAKRSGSVRIDVYGPMNKVVGVFALTTAQCSIYDDELGFRNCGDDGRWLFSGMGPVLLARLFTGGDTEKELIEAGFTVEKDEKGRLVATRKDFLDELKLTVSAQDGAACRGLPVLVKAQTRDMGVTIIISSSDVNLELKDMVFELGGH